MPKTADLLIQRHRDAVFEIRGAEIAVQIVGGNPMSIKGNCWDNASRQSADGTTQSRMLKSIEIRNQTAVERNVLEFGFDKHDRAYSPPMHSFVAHTSGEGSLTEPLIACFRPLFNIPCENVIKDVGSKLRQQESTFINI
jgi:hypothetical protein